MDEQDYQQQRDGLTRMLEQLRDERVQAQRAWTQARWHDRDPEAEAAAQSRLDELHQQITEAAEFADQIDQEFRPKQPWWQRLSGYRPKEK